MALSEQQKETVLDNLKQKVRGVCPMCGKNQWTLGDELVASIAAGAGGGLGIGGPYIPMVQMVCNNCGFVAHHAVGYLGIKLR